MIHNHGPPDSTDSMDCRTGYRSLNVVNLASFSFSSYRIRTEYLRQYSVSGPVFITFLVVGDKIPDRSNFWKKGSVLADWFYVNLAELGSF